MSIFTEENRKSSDIQALAAALALESISNNLPENPNDLSDDDLKLLRMRYNTWKNRLDKIFVESTSAYYTDKPSS